MPDGDWVRRELSYRSSICQHIGRKHAACMKCVEACPHQALTAGDTAIELDPERCDDCGDCVAICPSGALSRKSEAHEPFAQRLKGCGGKILVLCEEASWHGLVEPALQSGTPLPPAVEIILVEGIGFLSEMDLAHTLHASGRAVVVLALAEGSEERPSDSDRPFAKAAELMAQVTEHLFSGPLFHVFTNVQTFQLRIHEIVESHHADLPPLDFSSPGQDKRAALRGVLDQWLRMAGPRLRGDPSAPATRVAHPAFATVACQSDKCTLCGACANQCKVKALRVVRGAGDRALVHTPIRCVNCGVCVAVCPENILNLESGLLLDHAFLSQREIARAEGLQCAECGKVFTTLKRSERVARKVRASRGADPIREELRLLCSDCRARKALFTYSDWTKSRGGKREETEPLPDSNT